MFGSRWVITPSWLSGSLRLFLHSSVYSYHLFLISSSFKCFLFLSFIVPIFAWNVPLVSPVFLKRSLGFPILLFSSISLHCSLKKALSFLAILWNCIQLGVSFPFSLAFCFSFLSYLESLRKPLCLLAFVSLGYFLVSATCTVLPALVCNSSGTLCQT